MRSSAVIQKKWSPQKQTPENRYQKCRSLRNGIIPDHNGEAHGTESVPGCAPWRGTRGPGRGLPRGLRAWPSREWGTECCLLARSHPVKRGNKTPKKNTVSRTNFSGEGLTSSPPPLPPIRESFEQGGRHHRPSPLLLALF